MRISSESFISRVFSVLRVLGQSDKPLTLHETSGKLELPKPTVLRLLRSLCDLGYVEPVGDGTAYRVSSQIYDLIPVDSDAWLRDRILPEMGKLYEQVNETTNLACIDGTKVRYVHILESTQPLRCIPDDRLHDEMLRTALGRVVMAHWPKDEIDKKIAGLCKLAGYRDVKGMREELMLTKQRAWAFESGQGSLGVDCIAVALLEDGVPYAGVSLSVPSVRLNKTYHTQLVAGLKDLVARLQGAENLELVKS